MSAGCIPNESDRKAVIERAVLHLEKALKILRQCSDPDKAPRELETASGALSRALGDFYHDGTNEYNPEAPKEPGLRRLLEHYFS